jgi:murein DD-endopeptidase MepM/ murein hydrolase activator NlpD
VLISQSVDVKAAYRGARPIHPVDGYVNEDYLYGVVDDATGAIHKGLDFMAPMDRTVYAFTNGVVVDMREDYEPDCKPDDPEHPYCPPFGNFVLVKSNLTHYDRTNSQMAYVYTLYAHLDQWGVLVSMNEGTYPDKPIGQVGTTGNSSGPHLHFQIMVDTNPNRTLDLSWTEVESRNPELWLTPYNGTTGTVVGKVTDIYGNPLGGIRVSGLQKPYLGYIAYAASWTYYYAGINPDDILVENWGTTDVTPGTYYIALDTGYDLGWHTVEAGHITYAGLFPSWLPLVRNVTSGAWQSDLYIRNNSDNFIAQVNTTFFAGNDTVVAQNVDYIAPHETRILLPPYNFGDGGRASVVSSEDISVLVQKHSSTNTQQTSYTGILPKAENGALGLEEVGDTLYAPVIKRNRGGRSSTIYVYNAGVAQTIVTVKYYDDATGTPRIGGMVTVYPYSWVSFTPDGGGSGGCNANDTVCTAKIYSSSPPQPLAGVVSEYNSTTGLEMVDYNLLHIGSSQVYFPVAKYQRGYMTTGIRLQNLDGSARQLWAEYVNLDGSTACTFLSPPSVPPLAGWTVNPSGCIPPNFLGSVVAGSSGGNLIGMANEASDSGQVRKKAYSSFLEGTRKAIAPLVYGNITDWFSGVQVLNTTYSYAQNVVVCYYNPDGTSFGDCTVLNPPIPPRGMRAFFPPDNFIGSMVIESDQDIAVTVNIANRATTGDTHSYYNLSSR